MAQVYQFVDDNGVTRLFAEIVPDPAGTPFNGGTITQTLVSAITDPNGQNLQLKPASGASANGTDALEWYDDAGNLLGWIGADGSLVTKLDGASGFATVTMQLATSGTTFFNVREGTMFTDLLKITPTAIGFYDHAPATQAGAIADAAGGAVIDVEARAALNALLAAVRALGLIAT